MKLSSFMKSSSSGTFQAHSDAWFRDVIANLPTRLQDMEAFVHQYFDTLLPAERDALQPEDAAAIASTCAEFIQQSRTPATPQIRVREVTGPHGARNVRTEIVIVNDDMPFLVDSTLAELSRQGFMVYRMYHPILHVQRDAKGIWQNLAKAGQEESSESLIYVETSPLPEGTSVESLTKDIASVLQAVRLAVQDWQQILTKAEQSRDSFNEVATRFNREEIAEAQDFIQWLVERNFVFLGYIEYDFYDERGKENLSVVPGSELGVFKLDNLELKPQGLTGLPPEVMHFALVPQLVEITKSGRKSLVHRPVHMDYIGIKRFDRKGRVVGERRLLGLFTSTVYYQSTDTIPIIRRKVAQVMGRSGFRPGGHAGKALKTILEFFPRDELFQISEDDLYEFALGILALEARPDIRLFVRRDTFERFLSCMAFFPRDRFSTFLREQVQAILERSFGGQVTAFYTQLTDSPLARVQFIIKTTPGQIPDVDIGAVEAEIARVANEWSDLLMEELMRQHGPARAERLQRHYAQAFPKSYMNITTAESAVYDIEKINQAIEHDRLALELYVQGSDNSIHVKLYNPRQQVALSDILPMLENLGFRIIEEHPFLVRPTGQNQPHVWIRDLRLEPSNGSKPDIPAIKALFEDALSRVWHQEVENDGFNALVIRAGLTAREVVLIRAYAKYLRQATFSYSQNYIEQVLGLHPGIIRAIVDLFYARFKPDHAGSQEWEDRQKEKLERIEKDLAAVSNLAEDRILRRFMDLIRATWRTNFFQVTAEGNPKSYLSFKLNSSAVPELPLPRPYAEIFVYSMRVEGIHLRGGKVARGGLRWSDRGEDFRTEVLGLMKAQMVKNAVIVPVGSKGGFFVKHPPKEGGREAMMAEGIECYKTFLRGLLDVTDNIVEDCIVPPENVVRHDGDDPYLVVAADKGTATFSDIANSVSAEYGFWLGDAFASGGSAGYDHKGMGITARGAWISVTRHFREMGVDIATTPFSVVGIGDMSGDVFGNGMLLSDNIRLLAAFDHRHIFIDPAPDPKKSFAERKRMFDLPRSSWADYNVKLISKGGGVYERALKSITLSKEAQDILGIAKSALTPDELIRNLLMAPVDLVWNGGIGTYVKAETETNEQVGDRANNAVRVNGKDLRCKVVGEGGNLGFTQCGRIEYARSGGCINTDAIDNSAGVDCSDHEVNIKIALNAEMAAGRLKLEERNQVLANMTDEVAQLVLKDNTQQTQAISIAQLQSHALLDAETRLMRALEKEGLLDRAVEFLPSEKQLAELKADREGLTRPQIAVLLSYSKMSIYRKILESALPDDTYCEGELRHYFPLAMRERFADAIRNHRLKREIIATAVTNSMVNRAGLTFFHSLAEDTGMDASSISGAYMLARDAFGIRQLWNNIEATGAEVAVQTRVAMFAEVSFFLEQTARWFLRNIQPPFMLKALMDEYLPGIREIQLHYADIISPPLLKAFTKKFEKFSAEKVPETLARDIAGLEALTSACNIVKVAGQSKLPLLVVGKVYFELGAQLRLGWLRLWCQRIASDDHWQRLGLQSLSDELYDLQRKLTAAVVETLCTDEACQTSVERWVELNQAAVERYTAFLDDLKSNPTIDFPMLVVASRHVKALAGT